MSLQKEIHVERWRQGSSFSLLLIGITLVVLACGPFVFTGNVVDRLTTLFIYVILAVTWNALAGYGGLVSVGQQAFFGLGAYFAVRLSDAGVNVFVALFVSSIIVGSLALPISFLMLRLRDGEFAIGMWVVAEVVHLLVNLDGVVQGETGTSLIALNSYSSVVRRSMIYWAALLSMAAVVFILFKLLRSRLGSSIQAIRDNEEAAGSVGVRVHSTKRVIFILAASGAGLAGALWLASFLTFQPRTFFSVQWTAYMMFMVLIGGLGTFEGPILGALLFFTIEAAFGDAGVWYLVGLGVTALLFALFVPKGIWGAVQARFPLTLLPVGYRLVRSPRPQAEVSPEVEMGEGRTI